MATERLLDVNLLVQILMILLLACYGVQCNAPREVHWNSWSLGVA